MRASTETPIPTLTIVTPTPGQPGGSANPSAAATAGSASNPSENGQNGSYTVQPGDTLYVIAVKFHVTIQALMEANSISDPTTLRAGQVLVIPR